MKGEAAAGREHEGGGPIDVGAPKSPRIGPEAQYAAIMERAAQLDTVGWAVPAAMFAVTGGIVFMALPMPVRLLKVGLVEVAFLAGFGFFALFVKTRHFHQHAMDALVKLEEFAQAKVPWFTAERDGASHTDRLLSKMSAFSVMRFVLAAYLWALQAYAVITILDRFAIGYTLPKRATIAAGAGAGILFVALFAAWLFASSGPNKAPKR